MLYVIEHGIKRIQRPVVEECLRKRKDREQGSGRKSVSPEWRCGILANFIELRRVKSADLLQFAYQLAIDDQSGTWGRRESNSAAGPLRPTMALLAVRSDEQRSSGSNLRVGFRYR